MCQRQTFPFYTLPTAHLQDFCPWGMLLCTSCPIFCASAAFSRFSSSLRSKWKECVPKEVVAGPVAPAPPVAHAWVVLVKNTRLAWGTQCEVALHLFLHVSILPALPQPLPPAPSMDATEANRNSEECNSAPRDCGFTHGHTGWLAGSQALLSEHFLLLQTYLSLPVPDQGACSGPLLLPGKLVSLRDAWLPHTATPTPVSLCLTAVR